MEHIRMEHDETKMIAYCQSNLITEPSNPHSLFIERLVAFGA